MRLLRRPAGTPSQSDRPAHIGRYEVTGVLGAGATATVYLGRDPADLAEVAIKVLDRGSDDPARLGAVRREADLMRRVRDDHCVRVLDVVDAPPTLAIVTALVHGASLREVLAKAGRLTGPQALGVLRGALLGLIAVHRAGLTHGDVKPANILVDRRGRALLIDFGLAAPARQSGGAAPAGSPAYMSPEQIRGDGLDERSDVYACGAVLFELLTGRRPFAANSVDATYRLHLDAPVPDPREADPSVGADLAKVCTTAMAKDPADRYPSASAFLDALERAARERYGAAWLSGALLGAVVSAVLTEGGGSSTAAQRDSSAAERGMSGRGRASSRKWAAAITSVVVAIVVTVVVTLAVSGHHATRRASRPTPLPAANRATGNSAPHHVACTPAALSALLATPFPGDVVRPTGSGFFDLAQFLATLSLKPARDRAFLTGAGFRCGIHRFAQSPTRGETIYLSQVRDSTAARDLAIAYDRDARRDPAVKTFGVASIADASGEQMRESGGSSGGTFYENDVVFPCGPYLVQVGFGYDKVTAPTDAIALALKQRAALGGHC